MADFDAKSLIFWGFMKTIGQGKILHQLGRREELAPAFRNSLFINAYIALSKRTLRLEN